MAYVNVRIEPKRIGSLPKYIRNAKGRLLITVKGEHYRTDRYSKWSGSAYELAEIHTRGLSSPRRPFMRNAKDRFMASSAMMRTLKDRIREHMDRRTGVVSWSFAGRYVVSQFRSMMKSGKLGLRPLSAESQRRKERWGHYGAPLVASGQLADCITYEVV